MSAHLVIIGNGIAGVTAARMVRKADPATRITLISDETRHHYSRTALMYVYMGHMRAKDTKPYGDEFWARNRFGLVYDRVERVDPERKVLHLRDGGPMSYDRLVVATGSRPRRGGWEGEDARGVQGLYHLQDLERMEAATSGVQHAVVVGGGLIGIELAEMLHSRHIGVTFLVREHAYMDRVLPAEESAMVEREIRRHGIDLRTGTQVSRIEAGADGRVARVHTDAGDAVACGWAGVAIGVEPNVAFLDGSGIETARGVLVDAGFRTSAPDVWAVGDCAEFREDGVGHRRIEQLWYTGRRQGQALGRILAGEAGGYDRGVFFNSAKFFTIEYQTYGTIPVDPAAPSAYWEAPDGRRALRIACDGEERVIGFNAMGIRLRHEVCEAWIVRREPLGAVVDALRRADFEAEFTRRQYLTGIRAAAPSAA